MKYKGAILFSLMIFSFQLSSQCFQDRHSQSLLDSWASCEPSANPNPNLPESHWIMYDFSQVYHLGATQIWNFNYPGEMDNGLKDVLISYSENGTDWINLDQFEIDMAPDTGFYEGHAGPDLTGVSARYLLITAISNHGGDCVGLSEFKVEVLGLVSSTEDQLLDVSLEAVPNPCDQFFVMEVGELDADQLQYRVANTLGQIVNQGSISPLSSKTIDTKSWAEGSYVLSLMNGDKVKSQKITVLR